MISVHPSEKMVLIVLSTKSCKVLFPMLEFDTTTEAEPTKTREADPISHHVEKYSIYFST